MRNNGVSIRLLFIQHIVISNKNKKESSGDVTPKSCIFM